jgi:glycosyltransferase involved in cell wall biosynthesis
MNKNQYGVDLKDFIQISLIITIYKRLDFLDLVLQSVSRQSFKDFEVIIAEDDDSDLTKAFIAKQLPRYRFPIGHVFQEDKGFRKNKILNQAVKKASGKYLVFIDGDCILHRHFLREYFKRISQDVCLFGRRVRVSKKLTEELIQKNSIAPITFAKLILSNSKRIEDAVYLPFSVSNRQSGMIGCSFCVSKKNMIKINGFDEDFQKPLYGEDTDVARRLSLINVRLKCTKFNTIQYHLFHKIDGRKSIKAANKKLFYEKRSQGLFFCQNGLIDIRNAENKPIGEKAGMAESKYTLSVIIITKNEEDRIGNCLKSVADIATEIIVIDSGSTDNTVEIIKKYTNNVFITDWPGFGPQKQRALEKAGCDWVLSVDADEELTEDLKWEIDEVLKKNPRETAFRIPWAVTIFGKTLNYGRSARSVKRLFKREGAKFTDSIVHEKVITHGKTGKLKGRLTHYSIRDFEHYLIKNRTYAWLGAQKRFKKGKHGGGLPGAVFRAGWVFFQVYVLRRGFLDGSIGFLVAAMYSQGAFNKYAGLWTLRRQQKMNSNLKELETK